ncbi:hypothetical protein [Leptolyngbya sp. FACHB-711]|uniref:hypothetical protein n=1 Tax=unclassified Leptolyngbya TaxID=2650499 RepID=UPI0016840408|nr:hypothetical protein [Leptolyngbya sp. FACHB-711]MBD1852511.1 hypothetical protein [Cyanobacteria bacterium FACHB-502]MBD2027920.1 hypothetical protein [Leptolyngbya sp. FACHB-711]
MQIEPAVIEGWLVGLAIACSPPSSAKAAQILYFVEICFQRSPSVGTLNSENTSHSTMSDLKNLSDASRSHLHYSQSR